ncbi:dTDP-4-dehydrorhamnose reductase [Mycolicibacillus parakoreensis]|uniref:dTDP-4-dehydrorhamnose reductase n=2 Tax=Mycobacteriaceae TaxID=1762 RepID=A0ABY3TXM1_9MYCO|nr:dTDP-4-dehydrorhamnose reductase [Mycolicibacillus parakoreensis]MCV7315579.1 dTDP-4-dehydrorhamnose reductase [Mycolicibacillus parakoreensis]ULN51977.1 dTDP-4-dehydrorhamnose reductase [Mycolicibacillus parakoreensis]
MSDRVVITGAAGQLGRALAAVAAAGGRDVAAFTSADWDITDPAAARAHLRASDVLVNCAAYTDVDGAENDPQTAHAVNATGPQNLATACARAGARLIHVSTDYVFGGGPPGGSAPADRPRTPQDPVAPVNVYGASKLAGERAVLAALPGAHVLRTAWVYTGGVDDGDFVAVMRRRAAGQQTVTVVDDQIGSPTYVADLVTAVLELIDAGPAEPGAALRHAANRGAVSRFAQARAVFAALGADPERVRPVSSAQRVRPAPRPRYSALACAGVTPLRDWRQALAAALAARPLSSTP